MNIYRLLLRLYPGAWRARYEEEFLIVLAAHPFSVAEGIDVLRGAFDAYLHPYLGTTTLPQPERIQRMLSTLRSSLLAIFCAYVSVVLAGLGFQKLTEAPDLRVVAQTYSLVGISFHLLVFGAVGALVAVLAGGLPIVLAVIRSALVRRQGGLLLGFAVPLLVCSACPGVLFLMKWLAYAGSSLLVRGLFFGVPVLSAIISAGAVCLVVRRSELTEKQLNFSDYAAYFSLLRAFGQLGSIDGLRGIQITRAYVRAFFDTYLNSAPSPLLNGSTSAYPEVQFLTP